MINDVQARERIAKHTADGIDLARYLYKGCRCAVAHASLKKGLSPDDVGSRKLLSGALPIIRALAEYAIEYEFGILPYHEFHSRASAG